MSAATIDDVNAALAASQAYTDSAVQLAYIMITAMCILFMQAGFAFLETGACRSKNAKSILYKNGIDLVIGVLIWWFWGYGLSVAGTSEQYADTMFYNDALSFFISVAFCTTAATIVSGAVTERINFWVYMTSTISIAGISYPLIVQWTWTSYNTDYKMSGWLYEEGVLDFAGSGVVHLLGAVAAFVTSALVGPRIGRFTKNPDGSLTAHNIAAYDPVMCTIGTWILIFGWLSFNGSSSGASDLTALQTSVRAIVMTLIALAAGGFSCTVLQIPSHTLNLGALNNGMLGSLVAVTAGCAYMDAVGAFFTGLIGGMISLVGHKIPEYFGVDDPLDTFTVHGLNGFWGLIAVGLFARETFVGEGERYGCFYGDDGTLLGFQIAFGLVVTTVAAVVALVSLGSLYFVGKYVIGMEGNILRVPEDVEHMGLDMKEFGGYVFSEDKWQIDALMQKMAAYKSANGSAGTTAADYGKSGDVEVPTVPRNDV